MIHGRPRLVSCLLLLCAACSSKTPNAPVAGAPDSAETGCAEPEGQTLGVDDETKPDVTCPGKFDIVLCYGRWAATCNAKGKLESLVNCRASGDVCSPGKCKGGNCGGCLKCLPGSTSCGSAGERYTCKADGSAYELSETCDEKHGQRCGVNSSKCEDLCSVAAQNASYIGCEYWAVPTSNSELKFSEVDSQGLCQPFPFAVVISNTEGVDAQVQIDSSDGAKRKLTVAPGEAKTVELPCVLPLRGPVDTDGQLLQRGETPSALVKLGGHHITSSVPVTVYQFNPLEFQAKLASGGTTFSYSADASLLLPVHALSGNYRVVSRPTLMNHIEPSEPIDAGSLLTHSIPGFVDIVGVEDKATKVTITSSAYTLPSTDGKIPALSPGQVFKVSLTKGEVLQLTTASPDTCDVGTVDTIPGGTRQYCKVPKEYDLTSTQIHADGKVQVIAGHDCDFVPYDRWACDHLEESMFPIEAWGKDLIMTISATTTCEQAPNLFGVLADSDDTHVSFIPASTHDPVTLQHGEYFEFQATKAFEITADKAILVPQYLLGQDYKGAGTSGSFYKGDPSQSLGIPVEQWRSRYALSIPSTYTDNFVNVIAHKSQVVLLDHGLVDGYIPIEGTDFGVARVRVVAGSHVIESDAIFGFVIYGFAPYTSYMLPGGLDLHHINAPE